jgi:hypothetical protein
MFIIHEHLIGLSPSTADDKVPVLRNTVLYYGSWAMFKEFFAIEFFALKTLPQNFAKNSTVQKKVVHQFI